MSGGSSVIATSEPRVGALQIQSSSFGLPIPIIYGTCRVPINLGWYGDFQAIAITESKNVGGKGGGGTTQQNTTYTYKAAVVMLIGEGQIVDIGQVWIGKELTTFSATGLSLFTGASGQTPWSYLTTNHPTEAIGYSGTAYVAAAGYSLTGSAGLDNHTCEVVGKLRFTLNPGGGATMSPDCNPTDVINDLLSATEYGAGWSSSWIGTWTNAFNYCGALGLLFSPLINEQRPAQEWIKDLLQAANCGVFFSEGVLKIVPYGDANATGNGYTYTANTTPVYDLTDDDFIVDGEDDDPVVCTRKTRADAFNHVKVEFLNRDNQYNIEIAEAKDQAAIEQYGLRTMGTLNFHFICDPDVARLVAQLVLQRALYVLNTYQFRLNWSKARLEPMDLVTLTDVGLGLNLTPVRITEVEEDEWGELTVTAEDYPFGVASATLYPNQSPAGFAHNFNVDPGNANTPIVFEPPLELAGAAEIWLATSGGSNWGGCNIWVSTDNAHYEMVATLYGKSRHGVTTASLASGSDPDTTHTLAVDLSVSGGTLTSGTSTDRDNYNTLCYVGGELVSYQTATLTSANHYDLTSLRRGAYGTTISSHSSASQFVRLDGAIGKIPFGHYQSGQTLYVKLQSFNQYGGGVQDLTSLTPFTYSVAGLALTGSYELTGENLVPNGNSERGLAAIGITPDGTNLVNDAANAYEGSWCRKLAISGSLPGFALTDLIPCVAGESYYIEAQGKASASTALNSGAFFRFLFYDASKTSSTIVDGSTFAVGTSYAPVTARAVVPSGKVFMQLWLQFGQAAGNPDNGKFLYSDAFLLKRTTKVEHLAPGVAASVLSSYYNDCSDASTFVALSGSVSTRSDSTAQYGGKILVLVGSTVMADALRIPFDPNVLYRIVFRVRQSVDPTSGSKAFYLGVRGFQTNGSTSVADYHVCAVNRTLTASSAWTDYVGYIKGTASSPSGSVEAPNPAAPWQVDTTVKYISPEVYAEYSTGVGGEFHIDQITIEVLANPQKWIDTAQLNDNAVSTYSSARNGSAVNVTNGSSSIIIDTVVPQTLGPHSVNGGVVAYANLGAANVTKLLTLDLRRRNADGTGSIVIASSAAATATSDSTGVARWTLNVPEYQITSPSFSQDQRFFLVIINNTGATVTVDADNSSVVVTELKK